MLFIRNDIPAKVVSTDDKPTEMCDRDRTI